MPEWGRKTQGEGEDGAGVGNFPRFEGRHRCRSLPCGGLCCPRPNRLWGSRGHWRVGGRGRDGRRMQTSLPHSVTRRGWKKSMCVAADRSGNAQPTKHQETSPKFTPFRTILAIGAGSPQGRRVSRRRGANWLAARCCKLCQSSLLTCCNQTICS